MKWLKNKVNPNKAVWVAQTQEDVEFVQILFDLRLYPIGLHTIWIKNKSGIGETDEMIQGILSKHPEALALGFLETPEPIKYKEKYDL